MSEERPLSAIIMAAGKGKRMKSDLPKVLHEVGGKPMLSHVMRQAQDAQADPVIAIVGHGRELVIPVVEENNGKYAVQEEQLGTGHAVLCAQDHLTGFDGDVIVLSGDVPLLTGETIRNVIEYHQQENAVATVITAEAPDPTGYGRVIRNEDGSVVAIREHKDCTEQELEINEINSGIYVFDSILLFSALRNVDNDNAQGEYYLPDVFKQYFQENRKVAAYKGDFNEIHGINNLEDLAEAEEIYQSRS
jgi:UDP-N-acetylglucosamine diphosphorylase/glucosamine-1-phosphate N-acetyltransferase